MSMPPLLLMLTLILVPVVELVGILTGKVADAATCADYRIAALVTTLPFLLLCLLVTAVAGADDAADDDDALLLLLRLMLLKDCCRCCYISFSLSRPAVLQWLLLSYSCCCCLCDDDDKKEVSLFWFVCFTLYILCLGFLGFHIILPLCFLFFCLTSSDCFWCLLLCFSAFPL